MSEGVYLNQLLMLTFLRIIQKPLLLDIANETIFFSFEKKRNSVILLYLSRLQLQHNSNRKSNFQYNIENVYFILQYFQCNI